MFNISFIFCFIRYYSSLFIMAAPPRLSLLLVYISPPPPHPLPPGSVSWGGRGGGTGGPDSLYFVYNFIPIIVLGSSVFIIRKCALRKKLRVIARY